MVSVIECASFSSDSEGFLPLNAKIIKDSDYVQPGISEAEFNQLINEIEAEIRIGVIPVGTTKASFKHLIINLLSVFLFYG